MIPTVAPSPDAARGSVASPEPQRVREAPEPVPGPGRSATEARRAGAVSPETSFTTSPTTSLAKVEPDPAEEVASQDAEPPATTGAQRALGKALGHPRPHGLMAVALAVVAAIAIVVAPLALSRMNGSGSATTSPGVSADAPLDTVLDVAGRVGSVPIVSLKAPLTPATGVLIDKVVTGEGRVPGVGDAVVLSVATFDGSDGTNTTGTTTGTRLYRGILDPSMLGVDLANAVVGVTEGSRIVLRAPLTTDDGTATTEITVVDILPTTATGEERPAQDGMPQVTVNDTDGTVALSVDGLAVPTRCTASVLVQGDGRQVDADDIVMARYTTVGWSDGKQQNTTYGNTTLPGTITMSDTFTGIREHLLDVPVGSRVVLSIPADQAAGNGAVAVVIDVLAIADQGEITDVSTTTPDAGSGSDPGVVHVTPGATP